MKEVSKISVPLRASAAPWVRPSTLLPLAIPIVMAVLAAYLQWLTMGLPNLPTIHDFTPATAIDSYGFPAWLRISHYVNLLFMVLLVRSGLQILMDHPRLYWNVHSTPGTEWIRFTPVQVPLDRLYTAKDDARNLSPWVGLPGGRHTLGLARHWHFISVLFWILNGMIYICLLFTTGHWRRIVPTSWHTFPDAWAVFVHYATFHLPAEPNGYYHYNALQQLSYFVVIFILPPLSILTGLSMSPALVNRFSWYRRLPGNRQMGRSMHFLLLCVYVAFVVVHVTMVAISGLAQNMNHIVIGSNTGVWIGMYVGGTGLVILFMANVMANWATWLFPRVVQRVGNALTNPGIQLLLGRHEMRAEYTRADISPFFWPNGRMPDSPQYASLAENEFRDYRLRIYGLVENPVELSLEDIKAMSKKTQITLHHCIQGWSGIAEWGGLQMLELMKVVRPLPGAEAVLFYSFSEGSGGGQYYDSHAIENMLHPQALLAYEMNYRPLNAVHGAPLRLRSENQLGFKMVKWIESIEFAADVKHVYKGEGGYAEDNEFFDSMADI